MVKKEDKSTLELICTFFLIIIFSPFALCGCILGIPLFIIIFLAKELKVKDSCCGVFFFKLLSCLSVIATISLISLGGRAIDQNPREKINYDACDTAGAGPRWKLGSCDVEDVNFQSVKKVVSRGSGKARRIENRKFYKVNHQVLLNPGNNNVPVVTKAWPEPAWTVDPGEAGYESHKRLIYNEDKAKIYKEEYAIGSTYPCFFNPKETSQVAWTCPAAKGRSKELGIGFLQLAIGLSIPFCGIAAMFAYEMFLKDSE